MQSGVTTSENYNSHRQLVRPLPIVCPDEKFSNGFKPILQENLPAFSNAKKRGVRSINSQQSLRMVESASPPVFRAPATGRTFEKQQPVGSQPILPPPVSNETTIAPDSAAALNEQSEKLLAIEPLPREPTITTRISQKFECEAVGKKLTE